MKDQLNNKKVEQDLIIINNEGSQASLINSN
jgi:hypothetical protein